MPGYEYKVIPAPKKPSKIKGVRGTDLKFAASLAEIMNHWGRDGWEYQRTDTLPCEERQGLTRKTTVFQNMLVFRRAIVDEPVEMSMRTPTQAPQLVAPVIAQIENQPKPELEPALANAPESPQPEGSDAETEESDQVVAMPTFRSSVAANAAPALAAATQDAPEGKAPRLAAPRTDPGKPQGAPSIAAQ